MIPKPTVRIAELKEDGLVMMKALIINEELIFKCPEPNVAEDVETFLTTFWPQIEHALSKGPT